MKVILTKIREWNMQNVVLVLIPVLIGVVGQLLLKKGMLEVGRFNFSDFSALIPQFVKAFSNIYVLFGFFCYFISSLFWMVVLSKVDLSVAYPLLSMGYVFILFASWFIFHEPVSTVRWLGVLVIVFGVILISRS